MKTEPRLRAVTLDRLVAISLETGSAAIPRRLLNRLEYGGRRGIGIPAVTIPHQPIRKLLVIRARDLFRLGGITHVIFNPFNVRPAVIRLAHDALDAVGLMLRATGGIGLKEIIRLGNTAKRNAPCRTAENNRK